MSFFEEPKAPILEDWASKVGRWVGNALALGAVLLIVFPVVYSFLR